MAPALELAPLDKKNLNLGKIAGNIWDIWGKLEKNWGCLRIIKKYAGEFRENWTEIGEEAKENLRKFWI